MGYFDGLTASCFKKDAGDRDLFFIWGTPGKGRVIPSEADGIYVRRYLKIYLICAFMALIPIFRAAGRPYELRWFLTIGIWLLAGFVALMPLWLRTRQWPLAGERLTLREAAASSAKGHGPVILSFMIVLGIGMVIGSLAVLVAADPRVGAFGLLVFGVSLALFVWMWILRRSG